MRRLLSARGNRGAAAVEFAIIFPILFLVIAGIVDFGRAMYTQIMLTNAAREGARAAIVASPTAEDGPLIRAKVSAPGIRDLALTVNGCTGPGDVAEVTASTPFEWILLDPAMSLFGGGDALPDPLSSTAVMRCN